MLNIWENTSRRVKIAPLEGPQGQVPVLRPAAVRVARRRARHANDLACAAATPCRSASAARGTLNFAELRKGLDGASAVSANKFLMKFTVTEAADAYEFTLFPDGRAIIKGTDDTERARVLYAKYIGN